MNISTILFLIFVLAIIWYVVVVKNGHLSFWQKAAKYPDLVYEELIIDEAWLVDMKPPKSEADQYDGPYMLFVPKLGRLIKIYGKAGKYQISQNKIESKLSI